MKKIHFAKLANNPLVALGCAAAGICAGIFAPDFSQSCAFIGDVFMQLTKMCVMPILMFSIISSFCRLYSADSHSFSKLKMFFAFFAFFATVFIVFSVVFIAVKPGKLSENQTQIIGNLFSILSDETSNVPALNNSSLAERLIPDNIFYSLAKGNSVHVLIFFLLTGIAIGTMKKNGTLLFDIADKSFSVCMKILEWVMFLLPVGIFSLLAGQVAAIDMEVLPALFRYVVCMYVASFICCVLCTVVISMKTKQRMKNVLLSFRQTILIAFGTRSSLVAMPSSIETVVTQYNVPQLNANAVIPIGTAIARFSMIGLYVSAVFFSLQIYGGTIHVAAYGSVFLLCVLMAVASAGSPALVSLSMLPVIFSPLTVPYSAVSVMLLSVLTVIDPPLTVMSVYINCTVSIVINQNKGKENVKK